VLDDVPGLGEVRRKTLLTHFGSLRKLRAAEVEEIAQVPGIGPRTAQAIKDAVAPADRADRADQGDVGSAGRADEPAYTVNTATGEIEDA